MAKWPAPAPPPEDADSLSFVGGELGGFPNFADCFAFLAVNLSRRLQAG